MAKQVRLVLTVPQAWALWHAASNSLDYQDAGVSICGSHSSWQAGVEGNRKLRLAIAQALGAKDPSERKRQ